MKKSVAWFVLYVMWCGTLYNNSLHAQEVKEQRELFQRGLDNLVSRELISPEVLWEPSLDKLPTLTYFSPFDFQLFASRLSVMPVPRLSAIVTYAEVQAQNNDSHKNAWNEIAQRARAERTLRRKATEQHHVASMGSGIRALLTRTTAQVGTLIRWLRGEKDNQKRDISGYETLIFLIDSDKNRIRMYRFNNDQFILLDTKKTEQIPLQLALVPSKDLLLVREGDTLHVYQIDNELIHVQAVDIGDYSTALTVIPEHDIVLVLNKNTNTLRSYEITDDPSSPLGTLRTVTTGKNPGSIAEMANILFVANEGDHTLGVYKLDKQALPTLLSTVSVGGVPLSVEVVPEKNMVLVSTQQDNEEKGRLEVYRLQDDTTLTLLSTIATESRPNILAVVPEKDLVFVINEEPKIIEIYQLQGDKLIFLQKMETATWFAELAMIPSSDRMISISWLDGPVNIYRLIDNDLIFIKSINLGPKLMDLVILRRILQKTVQKAFVASEIGKELPRDIVALIAEFTISDDLKSVSIFLKNAIADNVFDLNKAMRTIKQAYKPIHSIDLYKILFYKLLLPFLVAKTTSNSMSREAQDALTEWYIRVKQMSDDQATQLISQIRDQLNDMIERDMFEREAILEHIVRYMNEITTADKSVQGYAATIGNALRGFFTDATARLGTLFNVFKAETDESTPVK